MPIKKETPCIVSSSPEVVSSPPFLQSLAVTCRRQFLANRNASALRFWLISILHLGSSGLLDNNKQLEQWLTAELIKLEWLRKELKVKRLESEYKISFDLFDVVAKKERLNKLRSNIRIEERREIIKTVQTAWCLQLAI